MIRRAFVFGLVLCLVAGCSGRKGKPFFERREPDVEAGIAHLRRGSPIEALAAFDRAIARYPSAPEISLDRGLALLAAGNLPTAREAFVRALGDGASPELRAEALYDIGITHHREADAPSPDGQEPDRETVMQSLRDAIEAYRRSLRTVPGRRDVAWNLEIALRRQHEEEEEQRQEQQDQQDQQQEQQDQQANQDPQQGQDGQQGQQGQDPQQQQPQSGQDPRQANQDPQQGQDPQQQQPGQDPRQQQPRPGQDGARADATPPAEPPPAQAQPASGQPDGADSLTPEMRAMLDALDRGEGSLEEERARARAARENRRPMQDW